MTEAEYDAAFETSEFRGIWANNRNHTFKDKTLIEREQAATRRSRSANFLKSVSQAVEYAGDEGSLEARSLSEAERAGCLMLTK